MSHNLKLWSDAYTLTDEAKGTTIPLNFSKLIVTSNYTIDEMFGPDPEKIYTTRERMKLDKLVIALKERFA